MAEGVVNYADIRPETDEEFRYWEKVKYIGATWQECWGWDGAGSKAKHNSARAGQYGRFTFQGKNQPAHRVSWQLLCGPLAPDQHLDHLCENGLCQNVFHMRPTSLFGNVARSPRQVAVLNRAKTHCHRGHPFDEKNTYVDKRGSRMCRACALQRYHEKKQTNG